MGCCLVRTSLFDKTDLAENPSRLPRGALDGIYVLRTAVPKQVLGAEDTVRAYEDLAKVERAFRCLKTVHRFRGLLEHLATLTKNTIQPAGDLPPFDRLTVPTPLQQKAFDLLEVSIPV